MSQLSAKLGNILVHFAILLTAVPGRAQTSPPQTIIPKLPQPAGPFGVGRVAFDWLDPTRQADMAEDAAKKSELMVYLWYPTESSVKDAKGILFPGAKLADSDPAVSSGLKEQIFGGNWPLVVSGGISSHAQENASIAKTLKAFPVIIFSPGAFMTCFQYTSAIEDLVSHGYFVAAIEHTYEVFAVMFYNGTLLTYSPSRIQKNFLPPPGASPEIFNDKLQDWSRHRVDVRASDETFVLDKLIQLNASPDKPSQFRGRLDLAHVAAVGHSRGGWASIVACRRDNRFRACVNEDGSASGEGLQYPGVSAPKQPILYVEVPPVLPKDWIVLKQLHLTAEEWLQRWHETVDKEFRAFPAGGYFVALKLPGMEHYSFSDEVFLKAVKEGEQEKEDLALRGLRLTEDVTRTFLDDVLKGEKQIRLQDTPDMTVKRFLPKN